jgi:hypothetical protein
VDWLKFISSIIDSLAWPSVIIIILIILRTPILALLNTISSFRYKDIELNFSKRVEIFEKQAKAASLVPQELRNLSQEELPPVSIEYLEKVAEVSPRAALVESWILVEDAVRKAAERLDLDVDSRTPIIKVINKLTSEGLINPAIERVVSTLRMLRNDAAHVSDYALSPGEAIDLVNVSFQIVEVLRRLGRD